LAGAFTLLGQISDRTTTHFGRSIHTVRSGIRQDNDTFWQEHSHCYVRSQTGQGHILAGAFTLLGQVSDRTRTHFGRSIHTVKSGLGQDKDTFLAGAFTLLGQISDRTRTHFGRSIHTVRSGLGQDKDTFLAGAFTLLGQVSDRTRTHFGWSIHTVRSDLRQDKDTFWQEHSHC
jgi:transposase